MAVRGMRCGTTRKDLVNDIRHRRNLAIQLPRFRFPRAKVRDRFSVVIEMAQGKDVLHLGCSDAPFFRDQLANGTLLHAKLHTAARRLVGVDLSKEGVEFLQKSGFENVIHADVESLQESGLTGPFELIVAGELLEHLPNPGRALRGMKELLTPNGEVLITVPNAFSIKGGLRALVGLEAVHEDHCYYFSPATIARLLELTGLRVIDLHYYSAGRGAVFGAMFSPIRKIWPWLSDGLIVRAGAKNLA